MTQNTETTEVLKETKSVCPICLVEVPAFIIERHGSVYLVKDCKIHDNYEILISRNPDEYRELSELYSYFMPLSLQQKEYYLCATTSCNASCPICFLSRCPDKIDTLSLDEVKRISINKNIKRFTFSHGEATLCENLPEMIKMLRRNKKIVNIHTNGIKIADFLYALSLKNAGISQISIQFDGFSESIYSELRGKNLLAYKIKALENLKKLEIPVTLNVTIARGINEDELGKIFNFATKESFIKDVSFITYCHYDSVKDKNNRYIMPDELLGYIEKQSTKKILRKDVVSFQKLFYAYLNVFRIRKCFNYYHYLVVRNKRDYSPIKDFINLKKVGILLDKLKDRKKKLTRFLFFKMLLLSLRPKSLLLFPYGIFLLLRGGYPKKPSKFLAITFATICDPYKYDSSVAENCGQGIIIRENIYDSYGTYLMQEMRKERQCI
jgi:uncharacterized radical SAM superfamily Fe-S cluster-containing enzyme